jgi:hypothetical protein
MPIDTIMRRARRRRTGVCAAAIAALAAAAVLPAQAVAHQTFAFHGANVATVNDTLDSGGFHAHAVIEVRDKECEGHSVFAPYRMSDGELHVVEDPDGCRPGVGRAFAPRGVSILHYRICEQGDPRPCSRLQQT